MGRFFDDAIHVGNGRIVFHDPDNEYACHHNYDHENTCGEGRKHDTSATVLLVDGSADVEEIALALRHFGWRVFLVESVKDAIAVLGTYAVNLVVVNDATAGDDAGFRMCAEVSRIVLPPQSRPRVMMLLAEPRSTETLRFAGVDYELLFPKPKGKRRRGLAKLAEAVASINALFPPLRPIPDRTRAGRRSRKPN